MGINSSKRVHTSSEHGPSQYPTPASTQVSSPTIPSFLHLDQREINSKFDLLNDAQLDRHASYAKNPVPTHPYAIVGTEESRNRDRYIDVHPWANSRFRLNVAEGRSDYINASLVSTEMPWLHKKFSKKYIVSQGPRPVDIPYFWTMMWDAIPQQVLSTSSAYSGVGKQSSRSRSGHEQSTIIMVTKTHEGLSEKCAPYWEDVHGNTPLTVLPRLIGSPLGPLVVKTENFISQAENVFAQELPSEETKHSQAIGCDVRQIVLTETPNLAVLPAWMPLINKSAEQPSSKYITHYNFTAWPDHDSPSGLARGQLLKLIEETRKKPEPIVVHCSAGVGRSGTFIALEALLAALESGDLLKEWYARTGGLRSRGRSATPDSPSHSRRAATSSDLSYSSPRNARGTTQLEGRDRIFSSPVVMTDHHGDLMSADGRSPSSLSPPSPAAVGTYAISDGGLPTAKQWDPVYELVDRLREQRMWMVQSVAQLAFVYQVLREKWIERYCCGEEGRARFDDDLERKHS